MELNEMFDLDDKASGKEEGTDEVQDDEGKADEPLVEEEMDIEAEPEAIPEDQPDDLEDRLLRLQAEFDNYRKFMDKAMSDGQKRAGERMVCEVLEVLDNLERALSATGDENHLREGVQMVYAQMYDVLGRWGVTEVQAEGCVFDPYLHDAVERVEDTDEPNGTVVRVHQKGFSLNSNVIRHARVAVAAGQSGENGSGGVSDDDTSPDGEEPPEEMAAAEDESATPSEDDGEDAPERVDDSQEDDKHDEEN
jgi:molecular chaperone GrpE